jgi:hypothetical protein
VQALSKKRYEEDVGVAIAKTGGEDTADELVTLNSAESWSHGSRVVTYAI